MQKLAQRAAVAVVATALAAGTSALFGGVAFADANNNSGGNGGGGGKANANCLIPIGVTAGVIGQGGDQSQCNATGGGGGNGGNGAAF